MPVRRGPRRDRRVLRLQRPEDAGEPERADAAPGRQHREPDQAVLAVRLPRRDRAVPDRDRPRHHRSDGRPDPMAESTDYPAGMPDVDLAGLRARKRPRLRIRRASARRAPRSWSPTKIGAPRPCPSPCSRRRSSRSARTSSSVASSAIGTTQLRRPRDDRQLRDAPGTRPDDAGVAAAPPVSRDRGSHDHRYDRARSSPRRTPRSTGSR